MTSLPTDPPQSAVFNSLPEQYWAVILWSYRMSRRSNQHVVPREQAWAIVGEGSSRATAVAPTQVKAIATARDIARNQSTELIVHGRDGRIRERDSHGHDSPERKG